MLKSRYTLIHTGITTLVGACNSALGRAACTLYLAKCGADVTDVAPAHRGDAAGAGAGGVFRAKLITIMESPETDKKFAGLTEDTRGPSLVPL